jgi:hypothetical protein
MTPVSLFFFFLLFACQIHANVRFLPRSPNDLITPVPDELIKMHGCKVVFLQRQALVRDFPFLQSVSEAELREWVVDNFCYMSVGQLVLVRNI